MLSCKNNIKTIEKEPAQYITFKHIPTNDIDTSKKYLIFFTSIFKDDTLTIKNNKNDLVKNKLLNSEENDDYVYVLCTNEEYLRIKISNKNTTIDTNLVMSKLHKYIIFEKRENSCKIRSSNEEVRFW